MAPVIWYVLRDTSNNTNTVFILYSGDNCINVCFFLRQLVIKLFLLLFSFCLYE